jgi:inward rectifier potassium channel
MKVRGLSFLRRLNIYHTLLSTTRWRFFLFIVFTFLSINLLFTCIYLLIGIDHLNGLIANTYWEKTGEAFFFSTQTFTTVGYGRISPVGFLTSLIAALEALTGLLTFAIIAGLMYGRFARPRAYIRYSQNALFVPFRDGVALMVRMVPYTRNYLVNVEAKITAAMRVMDEGQLKTRFFNMALDISRASTLVSNWTLVHLINEESPLFGLNKEDIENAQVELLVFVQGFDESFSNIVISRSSYHYEDFIYGAKFEPMFHPTKDNTSTILHIDKLNDYTLQELPVKY